MPRRRRSAPSRWSRWKKITGGRPMKFVRRIAAALLLAALALPAHAADQFPSRLITLVVPLTPGTTIDILARLYADKLSQLLGQQILVLNKPGAGGVIGGETVANATPDG